ncbi:hypothetical protein AHMF7616_01338 [Adhaeribacter pallidiroseus]|uniref:Uncharacterized protein n=1 Tax=Adhaeribacter pallidiroseus TaxID=2072847 RepID=A0A369QDG3_9BACT|nr:hypothetical protein AHMF7616_01338 [Adhaeribacter pallidiroseus]
MQYLIEKKPYFQALQSYVLQPLVIQHTFVNNNNESFIRTHAVLPKEAAVYAYKNNNYLVSDMPFGSTGYTAGGVHTFITDMAKISQTVDKGEFLIPAT